MVPNDEPRVFTCECGRDVPLPSRSRKDIIAAQELHLGEHHTADGMQLLNTFSGGGRWRRVQTWKARFVIWVDSRRSGGG